MGYKPKESCKYSHSEKRSLLKSQRLLEASMLNMLQEKFYNEISRRCEVSIDKASQMKQLLETVRSDAKSIYHDIRNKDRH